MKHEWIGFSAVIISVFSFYTLVYHNYQIQNTQSLSLGWLFTATILQSLWFIFGIINNIRPTILMSPLMLPGLLYLIYLKVKLETHFIQRYSKYIQ
jgi:uncharacterized protein with PQ loop repeat